MTDIVIFGAGQIAEVAKAYLDAHGADRVVGFTVDAAYRTATSFRGLPLLEWESLEQTYKPGDVKLLGPLSYRRMNEFRRDRHREGRARGYEFARFIHPASHVYTNDIGENCFILENNVIQPFVHVGVGVIMWSGNHVGHHSSIGEYCFMASQVGLGGAAKVGPRCFLAGKVGIEAGVEVGEGCFLGTGALVRKNLPADSVVAGPTYPTAPYPASKLKRLV